MGILLRPTRDAAPRPPARRSGRRASRPQTDAGGFDVRDAAASNAPCSRGMLQIQVSIMSAHGSAQSAKSAWDLFKREVQEAPPEPSRGSAPPAAPRGLRTALLTHYVILFHVLPRVSGSYELLDEPCTHLNPPPHGVQAKYVWTLSDQKPGLARKTFISQKLNNK